MVLTCESSVEGGDRYFLAVVLQESCREVEAVINHLKPQVVFLELCSGRAAVLTGQESESASELEVSPGISEFLAAYEEAMKYRATVILGDRPAQITFQRTWENMPLWLKAECLYCFLRRRPAVPPSPEDL
ncbi:hypothetical protein DITRI_Ditri04bG0155100 [Diplodiscus trichospermus]